MHNDANSTQHRSVTVTYVYTEPNYPPLGMGRVVAAADQAHGPNWRSAEVQLATNEQELALALGTPGPHLVLASLTIWRLKAELALIELARRLNPTCTIVVGGPSAPGHTEVLRFFDDTPSVDVVVHGEGEAPFVDLVQHLGHTVHAPIPGLSFRGTDGAMCGGSRARISDLTDLSSPYGGPALPDAWVDQWQAAIVETNRGCPYGCTFCDWGQATRQRIHQFSMEQIREQLEWMAGKQLHTLWIADANFGIFARDLDIAEFICHLHRETGFPKRVVVNFAKGTHVRIVDILEKFVATGLCSEGIMSLQTLDPTTLRAIKRQGISTEKMQKMGQTFVDRGFPLATQLMLGLPESTLATSLADMRSFFDQPINVHLFVTMVLPGAPMNEPEQRARYGIMTDALGMVRETNTLPGADLDLLVGCARVFHAAHRYGILRYAIRWLQWTHGFDPLDTMRALCESARDGQVDELLTELCFPPGRRSDLMNSHRELRERLRANNTWSTVTEAFGEWCVAHLGVELDSGWNALVTAQDSVMPSAGTPRDQRVPLGHDLASWYADHRRGEGRPLVNYGPSVLEIVDEFDHSSRVCDDFRVGPGKGRWEMASPLQTARLTIANIVIGTGNQGVQGGHHDGQEGHVFVDKGQENPDRISGSAPQ